MSRGGTRAYDGIGDLPPLVDRAVRAARDADFELSCLPSQGRLLQVLAAGIGAGVIGETGTGCGVGLAWLASAAHPDARLISVERDEQLVRIAQSVFSDVPHVDVVHGDWAGLHSRGPFDLLVLDGGGQGKKEEPPLEPADWLRTGGQLVLDDFTPGAGWPPVHDGALDTARLHWLDHPRLLATEIRTQPDASTIVATLLDGRRTTGFG